ncbi:MAG: hypothetical protein OEM38_12625, partial [Gammaproteobacteria bacterium]|nr:hypothetical protein [Gammaproteobacteria bacterium]
MAAIQASKAGAPIYNIMQLYTCTDLIAVASYANSALDSLTTTWCAKNNESKYKNSSIFKKARNKMKKYILESKSIQLK